MKINIVGRIVPEDYPADSRDVVAQLATTLNPLLESIGRLANKGINVTDNLQMEYKTVSLSVTADGTPNVTQIGYSIPRPTALIIVGARPQNVTSIPVAHPFVSWDYASEPGLLLINKISGLQASQVYSLTFLVMG